MAAGRRAAKRAAASRERFLERYTVATTPGDRLAAGTDYLRAAVSPPHPVQGHVDQLADEVAQMAKRYGDEAYELRAKHAPTRGATR